MPLYDQLREATDKAQDEILIRAGVLSVAILINGMHLDHIIKHAQKWHGFPKDGKGDLFNNCRVIISPSHNTPEIVYAPGIIIK